MQHQRISDYQKAGLAAVLPLYDWMRGRTPPNPVEAAFLITFLF
jgi:hypothetical protein